MSSLKRELKRLNSPRSTRAKEAKNTYQSEELKDSTISINFLKEIPLLEKKLFSVIINNVHLVHSEDREYLLEYLSVPLQELLKKIQRIKGDTSQLDFAQFFDTLQEQDKLLVSHLVLEGHEYEGSENLDYLLTEFQKKTWKSFVANTKLKLEQAKREQNNQAINQILDQFQQLKKKLLRKGLV